MQIFARFFFDRSRNIKRTSNHFRKKDKKRKNYFRKKDKKRKNYFRKRYPCSGCETRGYAEMFTSFK